MRTIVESLSPRERRTLAGLGVLLFLALVFLVVFGLGQRHGYSKGLKDLEAARAEARTADQALESARTEWQRWSRARTDLDTLRREYFYHRDEGIARLRLDLQALFGGLGLNPPDVKFDYADYDKEKAQKVTATFTFSGSYEVLRRFLFAVEEFPRLLFVERVTFVSIEPRAGTLNLKIAMAAYYEL